MNDNALDHDLDYDPFNFDWTLYEEFTEKYGEPPIADYDEADYTGQLDKADYYTISPLGEPIQW